MDQRCRLTVDLMTSKGESLDVSFPRWRLSEIFKHNKSICMIEKFSSCFRFYLIFLSLIKEEEKKTNENNVRVILLLFRVLFLFCLQQHKSRTLFNLFHILLPSCIFFIYFILLSWNVILRNMINKRPCKCRSFLTNTSVNDNDYFKRIQYIYDGSHKRSSIRISLFLTLSSRNKLFHECV